MHYTKEGVEALLQDRTRPPGRAPLSTETLARILALTCSKLPGQITHWTGRAMARAVGVSLRSVRRIWGAHHLQPHRRWTPRGTQPSAPQDQRIASTYIFGGICPLEGKAVGLVLPWCNTEAMTLHLAEISARVASGRHAALLVDQAGWHLSERLVVPANITIVPLPAKCPELNPQENVWQFMQDNWLSNRVFTSYTDIVDHCCYAWNRLVEQPWTVISIGLRDWAQRF